MFFCRAGEETGQLDQREQREKICKQSTWHYSGGVPAGVAGCDKEKTEKMEVRKGSDVGSGKKFSAHVLKQHKE